MTGELRYATRSDIGRWFGVTDRAVAKWQERFPLGSDRPFPAPDAYGGLLRPAPLWLPERETEIRAWHENRAGQGAGGGRPRRAPGDFYEDDEPIEDIRAIMERPYDTVTAGPPDREEGDPRPLR